MKSTKQLLEEAQDLLEKANPSSPGTAYVRIQKAFALIALANAVRTDVKENGPARPFRDVVGG